MILEYSLREACLRGILGGAGQSSARCARMTNNHGSEMRPVGSKLRHPGHPQRVASTAIESLVISFAA